MKGFIFFALFLFSLSASVVAQTTLTVTHGPLASPTYIDGGASGDSVGDVRIWRFDAQASTNEPAVMDWLMTTTGQVDSATQLESRMTTSVVTIGSAGKDTILLQGIGMYPTAGATLKRNAPLERAVVGGTGRYAGVIGTVYSTHLPDGSWSHVINLK
ncbi:MAG: hypothetical protein P8O75_07395 [Gammaproteobacteria bacterium]|nr:hypothetical protein [Gammaproteobacteria bacterium]